MADPARDLQEKMRALRAAYAAQLPEKIQQVEAAWAKLSPEAWDGETLQTLHRLVHSLTGSGATFGFPELSTAARSLEGYLKELVSQSAPASGAQRTSIERQLVDLRQSAHVPVEAEGVPELTVATVPAAGSGEVKQVFIVENEAEIAQELALQLGHFGYGVRVFDRLDVFREAMKTMDRKVVVLMETSFPGDSLGGVKAMSELQQGRENPMPVLFMSTRDDIDARLAAARAGGCAYFTKPVNTGDLIDKIDELSSTLPQQPYRVLIVDDSVAMTTYYATVLEQAGMEVKVVNNPLEVMGPLTEFSPDLILMDIYMPECNGMDMAKVIRQLDSHISIPIVYLSAESDLSKQLTAMSLGGDDFLTKPIQPDHLVSSVSSRVQRSRMLRSFMVRDSLTGLLNHTAIKDQLELEVARAKRLKTPLVFAMVDIDFFKKVNDTYGHPVGDRVIKSLSRLLKQRLRETDVVGRYGGEEFAVIMSGTDGASAGKVLDGIREAFSLLRHMGGEKEFSVTFSCGLAELSLYDDEIKLGDAADRALYEAKHAGRNRLARSQG